MSEPAARSDETRIAEWITRELGWQVVSIQRQGRWRPAWFVETLAEGSPRPLYIRARRAQAELLFFPLAHEAEVLRVLHASGIPAPRIYGMIDDPEAIVMDRMPGRADLGTADDPRQAQHVLDEFMALLARMHALPPAKFAGAGLHVPRDVERLHFAMFERFEAIEREHRRHPEPEVAFVKKWLRRNAPIHRTEAAFVTCDSGQFLFEGDRVTSVLDMELAHIGDPALDLASLLLRDLSEPLGDLAPAFRRYEELTGRPVEWDAVRFYVALWGIMTPMVSSHLARDPPPELSFMYNLEQTLVLTRLPLEAVAQLIGATLDAVPPRATARVDGGTTASRAALSALSGALADLRPEEPYRRYRHDGANDLLDYLAVLTAEEPAMLAAERMEAAALLGQDIADPQARDAALEAYILVATPQEDGALVRLCHRRVARREALLGPRRRLFATATPQLYGDLSVHITVPA